MESPKNSIPQKNNTAHEEKRFPKSTKNKISKNTARRFSDEQIKSLESIFKLETKLEPKKKLKLARDLGLQPRQVAIWFQNKRARWKSKQIEQEYKELRENYDCLYMKFDDLKREKQSLLMQLEELNHDQVVKNLDKVDLSNEDDDEFKEYPNNSSNDKLIITKDFEKITEEQELMISWTSHEKEEEEEIINHLSSPEKWCTSNWWED